MAMQRADMQVTLLFIFKANALPSPKTAWLSLCEVILYKDP